MRFAPVGALGAFLALSAFSAIGGGAESFLGNAGSVQVQADRLDVDVETAEATLTGNVVLSRGDLKVSCPRIDLHFDTMPQIKWARGSGGVVADLRGVHAEAPEVELDWTKHTLELRGGVRLTRGQGWLQADKAILDIQTAKVRLESIKGAIPVPPPK